VALTLFLGGDPTVLLQNQGGSPGLPGQISQTAEDDQQAQFVSVVLADTEDVWNELFSRMGRHYEEPVLVLFSGQVSSACGMASAAVGPFYCPGDAKLYIDLSFYDQLQRRFGAPGDFAQAYVIAHEVGHHVQNLLGITSKMEQARGRVSEEEYNQLSVRLELQADFLAGVWAHHAQRAKDILEAGDLEEALRAASAIGDDALQKQTQGRVVPDSFTHGPRHSGFAGFASMSPARGGG
jgi:predicted metalloprotease